MGQQIDVIEDDPRDVHNRRIAAAVREWTRRSFENSNELPVTIYSMQLDLLRTKAEVKAMLMMKMREVEDGEPFTMDEFEAEVYRATKETLDKICKNLKIAVTDDGQVMDIAAITPSGTGN